MKRLALILILVFVASGAYFSTANRNTDVTVLNARGIPLDETNTRFMVTFEIQNSGPAKTITGLRSASVGSVSIMNPGYPDIPLVIPENSSGIFAMDGAHIMIAGADDGFAEGASIPITLSFIEVADVTTRVRIVGVDTGMTGMNHGTSNGIHLDPSPEITLMALNGPNAQGADISLNVENFIFVRVADDAPHVANEGHAHIYLNGLKLGRLYDTMFTLGAIPTGTYDLLVGLNSNTHQPYMNGDTPAQDILSFNVLD